MKSVYLHGSLAEKFGSKPHMLDVSSIAESVRALTCYYPELKSHMREGSYHVFAKKGSDIFEIGVEELRINIGKYSEIHFLPVVAGAKRSGLMKIILGAVLLAGAFFMAPVAAAGGMGAMAVGVGGMGVTYGQIAMIGLGLAIAGVSQLLSPSKKKDSKEKDQSFVIGNPENSIDQGVPVPIIIGRFLSGSVVISMGVSTEQIGTQGIKYPSQG